jgi:hypothetical protein
MTEKTNDNDAAPIEARRHEPDPHGQAAMLLVESLIHGLVSRSVISLEEAVEIVEIAAEVKAEIAIDLGDSPEALRRSLTLLESISSSLRRDVQLGRT